MADHRLDGSAGAPSRVSARPIGSSPTNPNQIVRLSRDFYTPALTGPVA